MKTPVKNIALTPEIAKRMKKYQDVNWSKVAQAAFVRFMDKLGKGKQPRSIEERLDLVESVLGLNGKRKESHE